MRVTLPDVACPGAWVAAGLGPLEAQKMAVEAMKAV